MGREDFRELGLAVRVTTEAAGGFAAGVVLPFFFTPLELVKARQQVNKGSLGVVKIVRSVWAAQGLRGLYAGHSMTLLRSTIGNASLFGSYELYKHGAALATAAPIDPDSGLRGPTPPASLLVAGVLAGWTSWFTCFPLDSVKTRLQVLPGGTVRSTFGKLWREKALYRGIGPVLVRAVPVHAAYLPVYDFVMMHLLGGGA